MDSGDSLRGNDGVTSKRQTVSAHALRVGYPGGPVADIPDFTVERGDFMCIVGANGVGKTALIKTIAGLIPPVSGELAVNAQNVSYLPQQGPMQKDFPASVMEVVRSGCQSSRGFRPFYTFAERRRAERIMERLGISNLASHSYRELSGGQRQKVLIARALVSPRDLLLLDEPTTALDQDAAADFLRLIRGLSSKGTSVIMVTHEDVSLWNCKTVRL